MDGTRVEPYDKSLRGAGRRRPGRRAVGLVALALAAIVAATWYLSRPRTLLDGSTAITSTAGWCLIPDMHLIGSMKCPSTLYPADSVFAIRWIPGQQKVSFVCRDRLWSAPAE